jgi:hypothetical protein
MKRRHFLRHGLFGLLPGVVAGCASGSDQASEYEGTATRSAQAAPPPIRDTARADMLAPAAADARPDARVLDTVAALKRASPDEGAPPLVRVLGYRMPGDGGGGLFRWDATATTETDGGLVFVPEAAQGAGRWVRLRDATTVYNVRHFGAHPDQDDNAPFIQAAIHAARREGKGGVVHVPAGFYRIRSPIMLKDNVHLRGEAWGCTRLIKTTNAVGPTLERQAPNRDTSDDFAVDAIVLIDHREGKYGKGGGIAELMLTASSPEPVRYGVYGPRLTSKVFDNVAVFNCAYGWFMHSAFMCRFQGCRAKDVETGFALAPDATGRAGGTSLDISNFYAARCSRVGYDLDGLKYSTLQACAADNIASSADGIGAYRLHLCRGVTLAGCGGEHVYGHVVYATSSVLALSGCTTYAIRGQRGRRNAFLRFDDTTASVHGCAFPPYVEPAEAHNEIVEGTSRVHYVATKRPEGGRSVLLGQQAKLTDA